MSTGRAQPKKLVLTVIDAMKPAMLERAVNTGRAPALKMLIDENADDGGSQIADVYALRKEPDKMFKWLEHAWTTHDSGATQLLTDPFLRAYKDDPRFIALAQKIGVMPKAGAN